MIYQKGSDLLLKVDTTGGNNWVTVAALRAKDITFNEQVVDVTNKDSSRWKEVVGAVGIRSAMVSGHGVLSDAAIMATISGYRSTSAIKNWLIIVPGIGSFTGPFQITQMKHAGQHDKEAQYEIALEGTGEISPAWVLSSGGVPATMDIDFVNNRAWNAGHYIPSIAALLACTRASIGYYTNLDGTLTQFPANMLRNGTKGLLVEEARTNIILRTQQLDNASWTKLAASVTADAATAPDGTATADKIVEAASNAFHGIYQIFTGTAVAYTYSVYVKAAERGFCQVFYQDPSSANHGVTVNLSLGTITQTTGSITSSAIDARANGWYRVTITKTLTASASWLVATFLATSNVAVIAGYVGDGASGIYAWGQQLEAGATLSSYIPTTTSSATRAADVITFSDLTWFDGAAQSLYAEWTAKSAVGPGQGVWNFTAADSLAIIETTGVTGCIGDISSATYLVSGGSLVASATNKLAAHVAANDVAASLNGAAPGTDTSATAPGTMTASQLGIDLIIATNNYLNQHVRRVAAFKSQLLSNAALQALST